MCQDLNLAQTQLVHLEVLGSRTVEALQTVPYGHEIKRHLLLGRKAMTNLDSILKSRDITLLTKVHIVKVMVFTAVMYRM